MKKLSIFSFAILSTFAMQAMEISREEASRKRIEELSSRFRDVKRMDKEKQVLYLPGLLERAREEELDLQRQQAMQMPAYNKVVALIKRMENSRNGLRKEFQGRKNLPFIDEEDSE